MKNKWVSIFFLIGISFCQKTVPDEEEMVITGKATPQIRKEIQDEALNFLKTADSNAPIEYLACFSYSGMVDAGQVLYLSFSDKTQQYKREKGAQEWGSPQVIEQKDAIEIKAAFDKLVALGDYNQNAFDGIQYECVLSKRNKRRIDFIQRIFLNNPPEMSEYETYLKLIYKS